MKRLQLKRYINEETPIFESRENALEYFSLMVSETDNRHMVGGGLYGEPVVAKYYDIDGVVQLILGIGVENGYGVGYHIIDTAKLSEDIKLNKETIDNTIKDLDDVKQSINDNIATIKMVESSSANIRDEYALINGKDKTLGEHIKIYKDNALVDAQIGFKGATGVTEETVDGKKSYKLQYDTDELDKDHEFLYIVYRNEEGSLTFVGIDYENFLMEAEFGDGLKVLDHVVSINIMEGEEFLEIDENGAIKTKGIHEAINESAQSIKDEFNTTIDEKIAIEAQTRKEQDEILQNQITENKVSSKDIIVEPSATGTKLSLQVDNNTITKTADAETIYDSGIAVLGTLLKIKSVTPSSAAIKQAYQLEGANGQPIGDVIEIAKESALSRVETGKLGDTIDSVTGTYTSRGDGNDTLNFIYLRNDGTYELVAVEISKYFTDAHFGKGLSNEDNVVSIKEGDGNEYLVVGDDTLSVIGVDAAIDTACKTILADAKEYRKQRFPRKAVDFRKETEEQCEKRLAELRKKKEERIASLPENLRNAIALYNSLSDDEKKVFGQEAIGHNYFDLDKMVNKQTTHEQTKELQDILVQTCIDFINENELRDIDVVYFSADSLQESARCNEWTPSTDSFLALEGMEYDEKCDFYVRRLIDKSF